MESTKKKGLRSLGSKFGSALALVAVVSLSAPSVASAAPEFSETPTAVEQVQDTQAESSNTIQPLWLSNGKKTQYPSTGGTWEYGFWNVKVRSYYTVNRCHGSSVSLNGDTVRSANTAAGARSVAEKWAVNTPNADDRYYYRVC